MERYNTASEYYKKQYGERTLKICVDGHFSCPNRDGTKGTGGCIFCSESGSGDQLCHNKSIKEQVENYLNSYKTQRANKFILYFQNYSNTYGNPDELFEKYTSGLIDNRIVGINIATRPDCIDEKIVQTLARLNNILPVAIELGLQTSNDKTGEIINRKYTSQDFENAVKLLNSFGIGVIAHLMVGLPSETMDDIKKSVDFLNGFNLLGIKIHSTYVIKGTKLAGLLEQNQYTPLSLEEYVNACEYIISHINPQFIIFRITGDAPKDKLIAPEWNAHKKIVLNAINKRFTEKDIIQGKFFGHN